jgi:hypothetical protein
MRKRRPCSLRAPLLGSALCLASLAALPAHGAVCAPVSIGWAVDPPIAAALGGDGNVYWVRAARSCPAGYDLARTPKGGGPTTRVALLPAVATDLALSGGGSAVVVAGATVYVVDLASGAVRSLASAVAQPPGSGLAADATAAYYVQQVGAEARVMRAPLDGTPPSILLTGPSAWQRSLHVAGDSLYYIDTGGVERLPIDGGTAVVLDPSSAGTVLAVTGDDVYWADGSALYRVPAQGGTTTTVVAFDLPAHLSRWVAALAVDGSALYWSATDTPELGYSGAVTAGSWRSARDGSGVEAITSVPANLLFPDGSALLSIEPYAGLVRRDLSCAAGASTAASADVCAPYGFMAAPRGFIGDGAALLTWDDGGLDAVGLDGTHTHLFSDAGIDDVRADAEAAYALDDGGLWRVPRDGSAVTQLAGGSFATPPWLDDEHVYVKLSADGVWRRVAKLGGALEVAPLPPGTVFFGVDRRGIYGLQRNDATSTAQLWRREHASGAVVLVTSGRWYGNGEPVAIDGTTMHLACGNGYGDGESSFSIADGAGPLQACIGSSPEYQHHRHGFAVVDGWQLTSWAANSDGPPPITHEDGVAVVDADGHNHRLRDGHPASGAAITTSHFVWAADGMLERFPRDCTPGCFAGTPGDGGVASDGGVDGDGGVASDGGVAGDGGVAVDQAMADDASAPGTGGVRSDLGAAPASSGARGCAMVGSTTATPAPMWVALVAGALALLARRRRAGRDTH